MTLSFPFACAFSHLAISYKFYIDKYVLHHKGALYCYKLNNLTTKLQSEWLNLKYYVVHTVCNI